MSRPKERQAKPKCPYFVRIGTPNAMGAPKKYVSKGGCVNSAKTHLENLRKKYAARFSSFAAGEIGKAVVELDSVTDAGFDQSSRDRPLIFGAALGEGLPDVVIHLWKGTLTDG